jgi:ABC-type multidrug transport system fused ATPase/permease subunit
LIPYLYRINQQYRLAGFVLGHYNINSDLYVAGVVLPFESITISFENVQYYVDIPKVFKRHIDLTPYSPRVYVIEIDQISSTHPQKFRKQGFAEKRLQLLQDITGAFRPGVLTALMGVSGAGKTTLMDVLSGRKTDGVIEGEIRIGGYPKVQDTYSRISGYCEQSDIHSPMLSIEESVAYSAWLRLPAQIETSTKTVSCLLT